MGAETVIASSLSAMQITTAQSKATSNITVQTKPTQTKPKALNSSAGKLVAVTIDAPLSPTTKPRTITPTLSINTSPPSARTAGNLPADERFPSPRDARPSDPLEDLLSDCDAEIVRLTVFNTAMNRQASWTDAALAVPMNQLWSDHPAYKKILESTDFDYNGVRRRFLMGCRCKGLTIGCCKEVKSCMKRSGSTEGKKTVKFTEEVDGTRLTPRPKNYMVDYFDQGRMAIRRRALVYNQRQMNMEVK